MSKAYSINKMRPNWVLLSTSWLTVFATSHKIKARTHPHKSFVSWYASKAKWLWSLTSCFWLLICTDCGIIQISTWPLGPWYNLTRQLTFCACCVITLHRIQIKQHLLSITRLKYNTWSPWLSFSILAYCILLYPPYSVYCAPTTWGNVFTATISWCYMPIHSHRQGI